MAHNINRNIITNKDAFFSVKEKAWHGLGKIVENYPTSEEAIIYAGLNYEVVKLPLFTNWNDGTYPTETAEPEEIEIDTHFATARTDTKQILGVVGSKYEVVQNKTAFTFFDSLVENGNIQYETAGALGNGERIFITAKMPDVIKVNRNDVIEEYIFLTTSHDGSGSIMAAFTPVRIVCNNTLNAALRNHSNAVYIKHTLNAEQKLNEAAKIMKMAESSSKTLERLFQKWAKVRVNDAEAKKLISLAMAPTPETFNAIAENRTDVEFTKHFENVIGEVWEYAQTAESQQMISTAGTVFGVYNAITGYYQNVKQYKSEESKFNSIMFGTGADRSKKAFEICEQAANFLN